MPDPLTPEAYTYAGGSRCPACGSTDLERRLVDQHEADTMTRAWYCETCSATWTAVYELTGYEGLCAPRKET